MLRYGGGGGGDPQATLDQRVEDILSFNLVLWVKIGDTNAKMSVVLVWMHTIHNTSQLATKLKGWLHFNLISYCSFHIPRGKSVY